MDAQKVQLVFGEIMARQRIPNLVFCDYQTACDRFAYVTVRDTLHNLGVSFVTAERLASTHKGPPRARLLSCVEHLR